MQLTEGAPQGESNAGKSFRERVANRPMPAPAEGAPATPEAQPQKATEGLPPPIAVDSAPNAPAPSEAPSEATAPNEAPEDLDPFEAYAKELAAEVSDETGAELTEEEIRANLSPKAQERFRKLANERREAREKAQQVEAQLQEIQRQNTLYRHKLHEVVRKIQAAQNAKPAAQQAMPEAVQADGGVQQILQQMLMQEVGPLKQQLQRYQEAERRQAEMQRQAAIVQQLEAEAAEVRHYLLPGAEEGDLSAAASDLDEILLDEAVKQGRSPKDPQVIREAKQRLARIYRHFTTAARKRGEQLKARPDHPSYATPGSSPAAHGTESQRPNYSLDQIKQAGYPNRFAAARDNFSRLQGAAPAGGYR